MFVFLSVFRVRADTWDFVAIDVVVVVVWNERKGRRSNCFPMICCVVSSLVLSFLFFSSTSLLFDPGLVVVAAATTESTKLDRVMAWASRLARA